MILQAFETFSARLPKLSDNFLTSKKTNIWLLIYKLDHIINVLFSGIRFLYLITKNLSIFMQNILQNLEEAR